MENFPPYGAALVLSSFARGSPNLIAICKGAVNGLSSLPLKRSANIHVLLSYPGFESSAQSVTEERPDQYDHRVTVI